MESSSYRKRKPRNLLNAKMKQAVLNCQDQFLEMDPQMSKMELLNRLSKTFSVKHISTQVIYNIFKNKENKEHLKDSKTGRKKHGLWFNNHFLREELAREIFKRLELGQNFALHDLVRYLKNTVEYAGSRSLLHKIILDMGFKFKRVNTRKILCERKYVAAAKITFLRKYLQYLNSGEDITFIFLDETWIYKNGSQIRRWVKEDVKRMQNFKVKSEGDRFTVLHAGYRGGFLEGCELLFTSKNNDADYHKTMDGDKFKNWVVNQLIPALNKLNKKCVVVMDNAPYHSVLLEKNPTKSSKKSILVNYLAKHINLSESELNLETKKKLWERIEPMIKKNDKKYIIDNILLQHSYEVLRLPPYHCQYNAIEMAWAFCKTHYNKHINDAKFSFKEKVQVVWKDSLSKFSSDMWNNCVNHIEKLISNDWKKHMGDTPIENIPPFIISLAEDLDSDDEQFSSEESQSENEMDMVECT